MAGRRAQRQAATPSTAAARYSSVSSRGSMPACYRGVVRRHGGSTETLKSDRRRPPDAGTLRRCQCSPQHGLWLRFAPCIASRLGCPSPPISMFQWTGTFSESLSGSMQAGATPQAVAQRLAQREPPEGAHAALQPWPRDQPWASGCALSGRLLGLWKHKPWQRTTLV